VRETERQRDRETERQRDRETESERDRQTERERDRETERERGENDGQAQAGERMRGSGGMGRNGRPEGGGGYSLNRC
jgi:hypothetical protein